MIDGWGLIRNALWIVGLAIGLAAWSIARWRAHQQGLPPRQMLSMPPFIVPFCAGMALFSLGLALGSRRWWETAAWAVLTVLFILQGAYSQFASRR
ncbi:MAG: hypothetical protein QHJ81_04610 [Anaerolineae bacterium]|nr:hypothetical protein [Anaerolineae bacterium]